MDLCTEEINLLHNGYNISMQFGLGIITTCKQLIIDNNFNWSIDHEQYIFKNFIEPDYTFFN